VLLVALGVSFPLYLNTFSAIRQVDPKLFETAQVLGFSFGRPTASPAAGCRRPKGMPEPSGHWPTSASRTAPTRSH
jgi:hypothetical protein